MSTLTDILDKLPLARLKKVEERAQGTDRRRDIAKGPAQGSKANTIRI